MSRSSQALFHVLFVLWLAAAGLVLGFCAGGLFGSFFGAHDGHGLGDLGYLFQGALLGAVAGLLAGIRGVLAWSPERRRQVALWAGVAAALVAGITAIIASTTSAW